MTSFLQVIAHEDQEGVVALRRAAAAFSARVEDQYGIFFRQAASLEDFSDRFHYASDSLVDLAQAVTQEYGGGNPDVLVESVVASYSPAHSTSKTAATHESVRKPRMCPYHKDVTDISLSTGDPAAGFNALQQHWGGPRHCEGDGYEGDSCKFKPEMTTKSYWENKAEKAQQRRDERAELDESQPVTEVDVDAVAEEPGTATEPIVEGESADAIPFSSDEAPAESEAPAEAPMAMAARTASPVTGLGGPEPKIDKRRWTPETVRPIEADDPDGRWPTIRKDIVEPIFDRNSDDLKEIGEKGSLERQYVGDGEEEKGYHGPTQWTGTEGQASPVTSKVAADSVASRCPKCNSATTGMIGEDQCRCHACGNVWEPEGLVAVKSAVDVTKNPIIELMSGSEEGFVPLAVAHAAIVAHKRR